MRLRADVSRVARIPVYKAYLHIHMYAFLHYALRNGYTPLCAVEHCTTREDDTQRVHNATRVTEVKRRINQVQGARLCHSTCANKTCNNALASVCVMRFTLSLALSCTCVDPI